MSILPQALAATLADALESGLEEILLISGGMINQAARVRTSDGLVFVKWRPHAPPGFFAAEAHGLQLLRETGGFRVPEVLAWHDRKNDDILTLDQSETGIVTPGKEIIPAADSTGLIPFLALEYLQSSQPVSQRRFADRFGEALANLHRHAIAPNGRFGLDRDNFIGLLPQVNAPLPDWPTFYRERRLLPQIAIARATGLLSTNRERLLMKLVDGLDELLADYTPQPVLLHGDLWSGNFLPLGDEAALIDPASYYGDREMEMAYIELFGGFPPGLMAAYRSAYPFDSAYEDRRPLHQLYPLLNHLNHFGETYGPAVDAVCQRYASK